MRKFVVSESAPAATPERDEVITISLQKEGSDITIVFTKDDGRRTKVVGVREYPDGFRAIRWYNPEFSSFGLVADSVGRVEDVFKGDK